VLDERSVPEESKDEGADENHEHKGEEFGQGVLSLTGVYNTANHLYINNIFFSNIISMPPKRLPVSGSEPKFTQVMWGRAVGINNNNCYAYAVGDYEKKRSYKSVPGERAGLSTSGSSYLSCKVLPKMVVADNPKKVYISRAESKCRPGYYKVMMFLSPGVRTYFKQGDFHFYKQHSTVEYKVKKGNTYEEIAKFFKVPLARVKKASASTSPQPGKILKFKCNVFSHKRGWATGPLLTDAKGNVIIDPRKASKDYGRLNYNKYCSSFCVKDRGIKVGHTHPKVGKK